MSATDTPESSYGSATADLRYTCRWLVGAGASVAAALVAGLNLRGVPIEELSIVRQLVIAVAVLVSFGLAVWLILAASSVLGTIRLTINDLADREMQLLGVQAVAPRLAPIDDELLQYIIDRKTDLLKGEDSVSVFYMRYGPSGGAERLPDGEWTRASRRVEDAAQYFEVSRTFTSLRRALPWGAAIFVFSVAGFVWCTSQSAPLRVTSPFAVNVYVVNPAAAGVSGNCVVGLKGVALQGPVTRPDVVTIPSPGCPATRINESRGIVAVPALGR